MNKRITFVVTVTFFIVQAVFMAGIAPAEIYLLNPPTEVGAPGANTPLKNACGIFVMAVEMYKSDTLEGLSKAELVNIYGNAFKDSTVKFDLEHLDIGRKGWTRYYPFSIGDRNFVTRIFLTKELPFQPKIPVISELVVEKLGITVQILPGVNDILGDCRIRPSKVCNPTIADRSA